MTAKRNILSFNEKLFVIDILKDHIDDIKSGKVSITDVAMKAGQVIGRRVTESNIKDCAAKANIELSAVRINKKAEELKKLKAYIAAIGLYIYEVIKINPEDIEKANQIYNSEILTVASDEGYLREYKEMFGPRHGRS